MERFGGDAVARQSRTGRVVLVLRPAWLPRLVELVETGGDVDRAVDLDVEGRRRIARRRDPESVQSRGDGELGPALGAGGFGRLVADAGGRPCIAIGGIREDDVSLVLEAGGAGVAVASGILAASDPAGAARGFASRLGL